MPKFWFAVIINQLSDDLSEGIVLTEGFEEDEEPGLDQLQFAILARAAAVTGEEAVRLIEKAVAKCDPSSTQLLADTPKTLVRAEREVARGLRDNDVSIKASFIGFRRDNAIARQAAISMIDLAIRKRWWWQFWT